MKRLFVTGTDTGVGKTFVTCAIARAARARGLKVFAFKPIETGCPFVGSERLGEDQQALIEAAGGWQTQDLRGLYMLSEPVAPAVAARLDSVEIDLERIRSVLGVGTREADFVVVEGAGGWRVPITDQIGMSELARLVGDVVVVARAGLGTINHSLLTLEAIERDGHRVEALVLSTRPEDNPIRVESNIEEIGRRWAGLIVSSDDVSQLLP